MSSSEQEEFERNVRKHCRKPKFDRRNNTNFIYNSLKKIKCINQENVTLTWSVFLNVLDMTSRFLPPNMVFVIKIHSSDSASSNDSYHVVRNDLEFKQFSKLARDENRSMTVFIHLDDLDSCGMSDEGYIESVTKPGKVQLCFQIPGKPVKKSEVEVLNHNRALGHLTLNFMKLCINNLCEAVNAYEDKFIATTLNEVKHDLNCQFCLEPIVGSRYECETCEDYNLCHSCFDLSDAIHGCDHDFIIRKRFVRSPISKKNVPIPSDLQNEAEQVFQKDFSQDEEKEDESFEVQAPDSPDNSNHEFVDFSTEISQQALQDSSSNVASQCSSPELRDEEYQDFKQSSFKGYSPEMKNLLSKISSMNLGSAEYQPKFIETSNNHSDNCAAYKKVHPDLNMISNDDFINSQKILGKVFDRSSEDMIEFKQAINSSFGSVLDPYAPFLGEGTSRSNFAQKFNSPKKSSPAQGKKAKNFSKNVANSAEKSSKISVLQNPDRSKDNSVPAQINPPAKPGAPVNQAKKTTPSKSSSKKASPRLFGAKGALAFQKLTQACQEQLSIKKESKKLKKKTYKA